MRCAVHGAVLTAFAAKERKDMSKSTSQNSTDAGRRAIVHLSETHQMTGVVIGEHFHVEDEIFHGVHASSLGDPPRFRPIALSKIAGKGHRLEYVDLQAWP